MAEIFLNPENSEELESKPFFYLNYKNTFPRRLCTNYSVRKQHSSLLGYGSIQVQQIFGTSQIVQSVSNAGVNLLERHVDILSPALKRAYEKITPLDDKNKMIQQLRAADLWIEHKANPHLIHDRMALSLESLIASTTIGLFNTHFFFKTTMPEQLIKTSLQQRLLGWKRYRANERTWLSATLEGTVDSEKNPIYLGDFQTFCEHFDHFINAIRRCNAPLPDISEPIHLDALGKIANLLLDTPQHFRDEQLSVLVGFWDFLPTTSTNEALPLFNAVRQQGYSILHPTMDLKNIFDTKDSKIVAHYGDLNESGQNLKRDYYRFASLTAANPQEFSTFIAAFDDQKTAGNLIAALGHEAKEIVHAQVRTDAKIEILGVLTTLWNLESPLPPKEDKPYTPFKRSLWQKFLDLFKPYKTTPPKPLSTQSILELRHLATDTLTEIKFYTKMSQTPGACDIDGNDFNDKKFMSENTLRSIEAELQTREKNPAASSMLQQYEIVRSKTATYASSTLEKLKEHALVLKKNIKMSDEQLDYLSLVFAVQYHLSRGTLTPRPEQIIAVLKMLSGNNLLQIATGEGKSNITLWTACVLAASNKTVDILTHSEPYAVRDANNHNVQALSTSLGLTVRNAWQPDAATADILFIDMNNNVLFDNQAQFGLNGPRALPNGGFRKKEAVIIDEADLLRPIMASTTSIIPQDGMTGISRSDFLELYQAVHDVVRKTTEHTPPDHLSSEWIQALVTKKLIDEHHPALRWINETNQWDDLIRATFVAWKRLKKDRKYTISYETQADGEIKPFVRIMHYENSGALDKHSHFAHFVHQAIVAHEQRKLPEDHKDKEIDLPEPQLTLSQGDIYHHLGSYEGPVNAISGTIGEGPALAALQTFLKSEKRDLTTTRLPKAVTNRRYDFTPLMCPDKATHYKELIKTLLQAKEQGRSTLMVFKTIEEINDFKKVLDANELACQIYDDTSNPFNASRPTSAVIINSAKEPGSITLTTAIGGRGADFAINSVIMTTLGDSRYEHQGLGRGGRNGALAITQTIYNGEAPPRKPGLIFKNIEPLTTLINEQQNIMEETISEQAEKNRCKQAGIYKIETERIQTLAQTQTDDAKADLRRQWVIQSFKI
jgi:hypothetical protein